MGQLYNVRENTSELDMQGLTLSDFEPKAIDLFQRMINRCGVSFENYQNSSTNICDVFVCMFCASIKKNINLSFFGSKIVNQPNLSNSGGQKIFLGYTNSMNQLEIFSKE